MDIDIFLLFNRVYLLNFCLVTIIHGIDTICCVEKFSDSLLSEIW